MENNSNTQENTQTVFRIDWGQFFHRFLQWILVGLVSVVIYFIQKVDSKIDTIAAKQNTDEAIISGHTAILNAHENSIGNCNIRIVSIEEALRSK